jgi:hypothetical protein
MGESGFIYLLIPIGYAYIFLGLLLLALIAQFIRKARFLRAYFLVGAVTSIPAFILGFYFSEQFIQWENKICNDFSFYNYSERIKLAMMFAPFAIALAFVALGIWAGAYIVRRFRRRRRFTGPVPP